MDTRTSRVATMTVGLAGAAAAGAVAYLGTGHHTRIGATAAERAERLPGDDIVPGAVNISTRAISIGAPVDYVWPWVAQLGQDKGGFYTYTTLENLAGCDISNAERIVPEWQDPRVGEPFRLHPEVVLEIAVVEPGHALVVRSPEPGSALGLPADGIPESQDFDFSWAFVVRPEDRGTRLVVRERYLPHNPAAGLSVQAAEVVSTVLTLGMLRGIRGRAERLFESGV